LDDFEVVMGQPDTERDLALLAELFEHCPDLRVLLVSWQGPLGLDKEFVYRLEPLTEKAAVELFRDRALDGGKMLLHAERTIATEVCELLGCVPLCIRQVATHMRADQSPDGILRGLRDIARRYPSSKVVQQRSREIALRYIYDHLDEHGQRLWVVMACVFAGAPGRADVRAVYAHFKADLSLDALLLWSVVESIEGRHHIIKAARAFGFARLSEGVLGSDEESLRSRHAAHYLVYAQKYSDDYDALERVIQDILLGFDFVSAEATRDDASVLAYSRALAGFLASRGYKRNLSLLA
jgi:hypothetical protein